MSGTQWTRHLWCFMAITKIVSSYNPSLGSNHGLCEPACHLPCPDHAVWGTPVPADGCSEQRHSWSSPYILHFPESAFPAASDCWNQAACEWSPLCTAAPALQQWSLAGWAVCHELCVLGGCHSSLCPEPSITVSAVSPRSLLPGDHNQKKETSRERRNRSMCLGAIPSEVLLSGCMTPGEDQPHTCCEGQGWHSTRHLHRQVSPAECSFPGCHWPLPGWGNAYIEFAV